MARARVSERLDAAAEAKLVVISAPAGFGKTTAVAAWLERAPAGSAVAWLSLDEGDRGLVPFWTSVLAAVRAAAPGVGDGVVEALQQARPAMEHLLADLRSHRANEQQRLAPFDRLTDREWMVLRGLNSDAGEKQLRIAITSSQTAPAITAASSRRH